MKSTFTYAAGVLVAGALLFVALNPESGALYGNPGAALGVGLIGLGAIVEMKKRAAVKATANVDAQR